MLAGMTNGGWTVTSSEHDIGGPESVDERGPEFADVRRYGRQLVRRFVSQARATDAPAFATLISEHLGRRADDLPVSVEQWPGYEHVNVQAALDAWLAEKGRSHQLIGMVDYRHRGSLSLSDLLVSHAQHHGPRPGGVSRVRRPTGPDDETIECLRAGVLLVDDGADRLALLVLGPDQDSGYSGVRVEAVSDNAGAASRATEELRRLAVVHNVYRGQVVSFGSSVFDERESLLQFHRREVLPESALILPEATFADIRRQVVGVARNRDRLRAAGQHLKRGLLLYGPPGVGKTHTVRYLVGELADTTIVELTGDTLRAIKEACAIARELQPSMIVVEDVDLIAEQRDVYGGETPLLFTLLNEMDGLAEDADVVFLLTTNRADLLEEALAQRPGRVDQAVHIGLPDRESRRQLIELYRGRLDLDSSRLDEILDRSDGVTASFLKELLRRAAVIAADREPDSSSQLAVTADDLDAALTDLLDTRNQMTRAALGLREPSADDSADDDVDQLGGAHDHLADGHPFDSLDD